MSRIILVALLLAMTASAGAAECVILLHGLIRTASSMEPMQEALAEAGFETINVDYPSRDFPIEQLAPPAIG
jgi:esterase/lipase